MSSTEAHDEDIGEADKASVDRMFALRVKVRAWPDIKERWLPEFNKLFRDANTATLAEYHRRWERPLDGGGTEGSAAVSAARQASKQKHKRASGRPENTPETTSGPGPGLRWGKGQCVWFDVKIGAEAKDAADMWLELFTRYTPKTRMEQKRVLQLAETLHDYARQGGVTRFQLKDQDAADKAGLENVHAWQNFRKMLHRTRWADIQVGRPRAKGKPGMKTRYTLTMPTSAVLGQSMSAVGEGSR
jgi:hypothetical protein